MNFIFQVMVKLLGVILILAGILGLFVPILPGIILIFFGVTLLTGTHVLKKVKRMINSLSCWIKSKY